VETFKLTPRLRAKALLLGGMLLPVNPSGASECFKAAVFGQWEGSERNRLRNRPGRRTASQDTDLNYGVREDLLSEARSLEQTYPIAKRIKNQWADYVVGRCHLRWNTGVDTIDKAYKEAWKSWMPIADFLSVHHFAKMMKMAVGNTVSDGDIFFQLIDSGGYAQVNAIEADRVSSSGIFNFDTVIPNGQNNMVGGIGLTPEGRPKFIRVWQRTLYGTFSNPVEIPKTDYVHLFDSSRFDARRGVTGYHAVLNALRDLKEIDDAQRTKTKINSKLALIAKVMTGQAPAVDLMGMGQTEKMDNQKITTEDIGEGAKAYMFQGDSLEAHKYNDPSSEWHNHVVFLIRCIAIGCNLPFGVVWSMVGYNKRAVLFELQQAARSIVSFQEQLEDKVIRPIAGYWLAKEIMAKRLPFHPDWHKFSVGRPPYISIDAGRDSVAALNEMKYGAKSLAKWYDETDDDWQEQTDQCIVERKYLEDACKKYGIDPNNVRMMTPNGNGPAQPGGQNQGVGNASD
jgi:capsid protein